MKRKPAVAGRFYPGDGGALRNDVDQMLSSFSPQPKQAIGVVSPHAGYIYSGSVAAETLKSVQIPKTVIILGLNHHGQGAPIALSRAQWDMPMGPVAIDQDLAENLLGENSPILHDEAAHDYEHSVEVQVPFLQALQPELTIVPLVLSHISYDRCRELADTIAKVVSETGKETLLVASSDMSHYETRESASRKDQEAIDKIIQLDPQGLYSTVHNMRISMCGVIPVTVTLLVANSLGATTVEMVRYTDSGEVSGDTDQVVGYAGLTIA